MSARVVRNLAYGPDARHRIDLHVPADTGFTTLLFVSGGGWTSGSRHWTTGVADHLSADGFGVARVDHRLLPAASYDDQIADVRAAFAWLVSAIADHGGNGERIVVGGHSAGGHLAAMVAADRTSVLPRPIGVIGLAAAMDPRERMRADLWPTSHVTSETPPHLLLIAENDLPQLAPMNTRMAQLLTDAAVHVAFETIPGTDHFDIIASPVALNRMTHWLTSLTT